MTTDSDRPAPVTPHHPYQPSPQSSSLPSGSGSPPHLFDHLEPPWIAASTVLVYVSYLFHLHPALPWIGLAAAVLPFPLRWLARQSRTPGTSFDPAIAVLMAGALIGFVTSPRFEISLGVFQCMVALCACYYSCLNYPRLDIFTKGVFSVALPVLFTVFMAISLRTEEPLNPDEMPCTYHGLALSMLIAAAILAGMAAFARSMRTRLLTGLLSLCLIVAILTVVDESVPRLFGLDSISGRLPRWERTVDLMRDSPFTGLGLGCWALVFHDSVLISHPTHAHNAYLELYSNTGVLGTIAFVLFLAIGLKLAWDIIRSPRDNPWYGFGIGVVLACAATLLVGVVESAPAGVPLVASDTYYYLISPVPWILAGLLVIARKLQAGQPSL